MSRIQGKNTAPELTLRSLLHKNGYRFRLQGKALPGRPDIVMPKFRTVIFVHGCFWHRHENCKYAYTPKSRTEFWTSKFKRTIQRDIQHAESITTIGWIPIVVWECELKENPIKTLQKTKQVLQRRLQEIQ